MNLPKIHSITKKLTVALLGGFLLVFLIFHAAANLLILLDDGGAAYGAFCHFMGSNPLVKIMEVVLLGTVGLHILLTLWLAITNKKARPVQYKHQQKSKTHTTSKFMVWTGVLIIVPTLLLFVYEYTGKSLTDRFLLSLFQAVTPRTAGFNTASLSSLSGAGTMLMIALMLIGGSPGSTAGGMKTTTLAVLAANAFSVFRRKKSVQLFGRRVDDSMVRHAATLFVMYLTLPAICAAVISIVEKIPVGICLFETASAIGTVGLSKGITPDLGLLSHSILIVLMFFGRVGGLTLIYAAVNVNSSEVSHRPVEKINVG